MANKRAAEEDVWADEKRRFATAKDAKSFIHMASHLLLQRVPELTALVRDHEQRIIDLAVAKTTKPPQVRIDAIETLVKLGVDASCLRPILETDKTSTLLCAAAKAIGGDDGRVEGAKAVTALVAKAAKPGDWSPQYDAVRALRYFDDPRVVPALIVALDHPQQAVRREAIVGLGHQRATEVTARLAKLLGSTKESQHIAAAGSALTRFDTDEARAALADAKAYAHALKMAKDFVEGRFAIHGLRWFTLPCVDDDLLALATASEDGEVVSGAIGALVARRVSATLPVFAKHVLKDEANHWHGSLLISAMIDLCSEIAVDPEVVGALAATLGGAPVDVLEQIRDDSEQQRYHLDRKSLAQQQRFEAWRTALTSKVKQDKRPVVTQLMSVPD